MTTLEADVSQPDSYSSSDDNPSGVAEVRSSVEEKLRNLPSSEFPDDLVPIFRVPDGLRKANHPSYTPRWVAIGPLHRDITHLKPMENVKLHILREFKTMMNNNIDGIITFIMDRIEQIRSCYEVMKIIPLPQSNNDLCEMMLLDSVFIIRIFLEKERDDPMFYVYWWFRDLMHDFLLVENQIPLFIPYAIYTHHYCQFDGECNGKKFDKLADNFFKDIKMASASLPSWSYNSNSPMSTKPSHFIEYLMMAYFPPVSSPQNTSSQPVSPQLKCIPPLLPLTQNKYNKERNWKFGVTTASRLLKYGVKFKVGTNTTSLVEIQFKDGVLTIPQIKVNDWTETLFRNLIAFEHLQHLTRHVTDYIILMDSLIDTQEDVNILIDKEIIQDDLQDPEKVSELFNNLYKEAITENRHYHFAELSFKLNDYRRNPWHYWKAACYNWMVILRDKYFYSPWSIISLIAAVILLGLTVVQTVCSILQA